MTKENPAGRNLKQPSRSAQTASIQQLVEALLAYGATEIYLFGSTAQGTSRPESDVDVAVVGLPEDEYYRAVGEAMLLLRRPVDVVDLNADTLFTQHLRQSGKLHRVA